MNDVNTINFNEELKVAKKLAYEAGEIILEYFDNDKKEEDKADGTIVTIADKAINSIVIDRLGEIFPSDGIIGEEQSNTEYGYGRKWVCDPIDGTWAFVTGVPTFMFSLALVIDGVPVLGVAYDPILDKLYTATKNCGAYCNEKRIQVSQKNMSNGILAVTGSIKKMQEGNPYTKEVLKRGIKFVSVNGAVFKACLVASGRCIAYIGESLNPHDVAATHIITEEAGGKVTDFSGKVLDYKKHFSDVIISNGVVHEEIIELVNHK